MEQNISLTFQKIVQELKKISYPEIRFVRLETFFCRKSKQNVFFHSSWRRFIAATLAIFYFCTVLKKVCREKLQVREMERSLEILFLGQKS